MEFSSASYTRTLSHALTHADTHTHTHAHTHNTHADAKWQLLKMAGSEKAVAHAKELVQAILDERDAVINEGVLAIVTPAVPGTQAPLGAPGGPDDDQYRSQVWHGCSTTSALNRIHSHARTCMGSCIHGYLGGSQLHLAGLHHHYCNS